MIKNRINDQFHKAITCIQSEVKVEIEKRLTNFKNIIQENFSVSIQTLSEILTNNNKTIYLLKQIYLTPCSSEKYFM